MFFQVCHHQSDNTPLRRCSRGKIYTTRPLTRNRYAHSVQKCATSTDSMVMPSVYDISLRTRLPRSKDVHMWPNQASRNALRPFP